MDTLTNITRRRLLHGASAALAAATVPTTVAVAQPAGQMLELIEAHRSALEEWEAAWARRSAVEEETDAELDAIRPLVPLGIMKDGSRVRAAMELSARHVWEDRQQIAAEIVRTHDDLRRVHCNKWSRVSLPEHAEAMATEIAASEARAFEALDRTVAEIMAHPAKQRLAAAEQQCQDGDNAKAEAFAAVVQCQPTTLAEAEAKIDWLLGLQLTDDRRQTFRRRADEILGGREA